MATLPHAGRPSGIRRGDTAGGATAPAVEEGVGAAAGAAGSAAIGAETAVDPHAATEMAATASSGRARVERCMDVLRLVGRTSCPSDLSNGRGAQRVPAAPQPASGRRHRNE
jgi:hypothetical protein